MNIKNVIVGSLQTNCYILDRGDSALIIDPGADGEFIINSVPPYKRVVGIIITHSHEDHTGALMDLLNKYNAPLYSGKNLGEGKNSIANFIFKVIKTPGHMDDAITIYFEEEGIMFDGDFIFKGGIGRTDLPGGNVKDMKDSIRKILKYPDTVTLMPGHYDVTTIGGERENLNYFLKTL